MNIIQIEYNLTENGKKYRNLYYELANVRKLFYHNHELLNEKENQIYAEMEEFFIDNNFYKGEDYTKISEAEHEIIENLPTPSDLLYYEKDNNSTSDYKSYVMLYPICQYFIKQKSFRLNKNHMPEFKKTYFGSDIVLRSCMNQTYLYCLVESDVYDGDVDIEITVVTLVDEDFKKINDEYEFVRYQGDIPVIKRKIK